MGPWDAFLFRILDSFRAPAASKSDDLLFMARDSANALVPAAAGPVLSVAAVWWFTAFDGEMQIASLELAKYPEIQRRAGKL
jgi:hypothetical protein